MASELKKRPIGIAGVSGNGSSDGLSWDNRPAYRAEHIRIWLLNWNAFCQEADRSFAWAQARADIVQALRQMRPVLRKFFVLYCIYGYEFEQIAGILHCSPATPKQYWYEVFSHLRRVLLDSEIHDRRLLEVKIIPSRDSYTVGPYERVFP